MASSGARSWRATPAPTASRCAASCCATRPPNCPRWPACASVYSSPEGLWAEGGWLDSAALGRGIAAAAHARRAPAEDVDRRLRPRSHGSLWGLKVQLAETRIELVIENDQTVSAGSLPALQAFFDAADRAGLELGMT